MGLRRASVETDKIDLGDGAYVEVSQSLSKRDFNNLVKRMPSDVSAETGLSVEQGLQFQTAMFTTFVKGWSLDGELTEEEYLNLESEDARALDEALMKHFEKFTP